MTGPTTMVVETTKVVGVGARVGCSDYVNTIPLGTIICNNRELGAILDFGMRILD